jgi:hypothetical protein
MQWRGHSGMVMMGEITECVATMIFFLGTIAF